jgi:hypothetical protein
MAGAPPAAASVTVVDVDHVGSLIRHLGETTFRGVYSAVSVDEATRTVHLDVTGTGLASKALAAVAGLVHVVTRVVSHSYDALAAMQQSVIADTAMWHRHGAVITDVGPDAGTGRLFIGVRHYTPGIGAEMSARYGAASVRVGEFNAGVGAASRTADSSPWNAGDLIGAGSTICTTGFGVHASTSSTTATGPWLALAGHCFANGTTVTNNGHTVGKVSRATGVYKDYGDDISVILGQTSSSSSKYIWETNTARARNDGSITGPAVGSSVCHSGASTNEKCGTVRQVNQCFLNSDTGLHMCHQDYVTSSSLLAAGGDSGGPWFQAYTSGTTRYDGPVGINSLIFNMYNCSTQTGTQRCGNASSYTEMDEFASVYNVWPNY